MIVVGLFEHNNDKTATEKGIQGSSLIMPISNPSNTAVCRILEPINTHY